MAEPPINPNVPIFRWGPIPGHWFYVSRWNEMCHKDFPARYGGAAWPRALFLCQGGRMICVMEDEAMRKQGLKWFTKLVLPPEQYRREREAYESAVKHLTRVEQDIEAVEISAVSNEELTKLWNELHAAYGDFWLPTQAPEIGNYGAERLLEEKLQAFITDSAELASALETLTTVEELSFYQQEEIELAETSEVAEHQRKYFWLKNSYAGSQILPVEFFKERKQSLGSNVRAEFEGKLANICEKKENLQKRYRLPEEVMQIGQRISQAAAWQDDRKKYIFIAIHYQNQLLQEIEQRFEYSHDELVWAGFGEVSEITRGKDLHQLLAEHTAGFGVNFFTDCQHLNPEQVAEYWNMFATEKVQAGQAEVQGIVASRGREPLVRGRVHILLDPHNVQAFQAGEILIAPMTSPEYVFAMKKAAAIVTDAGGLTSHAAIVSRELNLPCIVNTKAATQVFHDGDQVEVNAEKGVVHII